MKTRTIQTLIVTLGILLAIAATSVKEKPKQELTTSCSASKVPELMAKYNKLGWKVKFMVAESVSVSLKTNSDYEKVELRGLIIITLEK